MKEDLSNILFQIRLQRRTYMQCRPGSDGHQAEFRIPYDQQGIDHIADNRKFCPVFSRLPVPQRNLKSGHSDGQRSVRIDLMKQMHDPRRVNVAYREYSGEQDEIIPDIPCQDPQPDQKNADRQDAADDNDCFINIMETKMIKDLECRIIKERIMAVNSVYGF